MDGGIESKGSVAVAVALCRCLPLACLIVAVAAWLSTRPVAVAVSSIC